jgi:hypothetical protein
VAAAFPTADDTDTSRRSRRQWTLVDRQFTRSEPGRLCVTYIVVYTVYGQP